MKYPIYTLFIGLLTYTSTLTAQITLHQCLEWAETYSVLTDQKALIDDATKWAIKAINTGFLPQMQMTGDVSYQSDNLSLPSLGLSERALDKYKAEVSFSQVLYDGGGLSGNKKMRQVISDIEKQQLEVAMQQLKTNINDIYLSVLLIDENRRVVGLQLKELTNQKSRLLALLEAGIILRSEIDVVDAEILMIKQKDEELRYNRKTAINKLAEYTNQPLVENTVLVYPTVTMVTASDSITRPELSLFDLQIEQLNEVKALSQSKALPQLNLYALGGYGRPTFDLLSDKFDWYYMVGFQVKVPLTGWISSIRERKGADVAKRIIHSQKEEFNRNNGMMLREQQSIIDKFLSLIQTDNQVIEKRVSIRERTAARLENGAVTSTEYITDLNLETQARLQQKLHQIQLLHAQIKYNALYGKF